MDPNATIVISDSDSDNESLKAKTKHATSHHFIPILPKIPIVNKPPFVPLITTKRKRHIQGNPHFTSNFSKIAVKGFAKEKKNSFEETTELNFVSVNNQPVIHGNPQGMFVDVADTLTNPSENNVRPSAVVKPISVLRPDVLKKGTTQNKNIGTATKFIRTSSNETPVSKSHCPEHVRKQTIKPKTDLKNKNVTLNDIINKTISDSLTIVQASDVQTNNSKNVTTSKQLHKNSEVNLQQSRSPVLYESSSDGINYSDVQQITTKRSNVRRKPNNRTDISKNTATTEVLLKNGSVSSQHLCENIQLQSPIVHKNLSNAINNFGVQQVVTNAAQSIPQISNKKIKNPKNTATTETLQRNSVSVGIEQLCGNVGINLQLLPSSVLCEGSSDVPQIVTKASNKSVLRQTQSNKSNMSKHKTTAEALQINNEQVSAYRFCDCNGFHLPPLHSTLGVINNSDTQQIVTKNVQQTSNNTDILKNVATIELSQTNNIPINNHQRLCEQESQLPVLYVNSSNVINNSDGQQIVTQTSNMTVQNILQIPSSLPGMLMAMPSLQETQNIYLIQIPSNTQLALNYTPQGNQVQSVNNQQIVVENTPNTPMVLENPETSTSVNNLSLNQNVTITKENSPKKCVTAQRCLDLRKSNAKLDFEGFTSYDRLGFFKAEEKRAKRCTNISNAHIKVRETVVRKLLVKQAAYNKQDEVPYRNRMKQLVEKCKILKNRVPVTTTHKKTIKTASRVIQEMNEVLQKEIVETKPKILEKKQNNFYGCNLVELRVVLKRGEVEQYLRMKRKKKLKEKFKLQRQKRLATLKDKSEVSKQKVSITFGNCTTLKDILSFTLNNSFIFVDENYFEIIEKLYPSVSQIYFVNKHTVMTCLYMEYFPLFKTALQTGKVRIVDTSVFEKYISLRKRSKDVTVKTYCNLYKNSASKWRNRLKRANFYRRVADFHSMQKINQHYPKKILSEHNYYIAKKT